ncbi:glycosyl hydrolase family 8, partial [Proteus mirabilis]
MSIRQLSRLTHRLGILLTLSVMLMISPMTQATETQAGWQQFKARYITPEGRVIDSANQNISHSEGQGYGMLMAVMSDDRQTFAQLWHWTAMSLYRGDLGLFKWRYEPEN